VSVPDYRLRNAAHRSAPQPRRALNVVKYGRVKSWRNFIENLL
jgi:hypothetical protein